MIDASKVLTIVTARGGSKGLPGKNIMPLNGIPLITWTILAAKESKYVDRIVASTDDESIAAIALDSGCEVPFMRPPSLATDEATSADVVQHTILSLDEDFDIIVLLQPTSPLRHSEDIDGCIEVCNGHSVSCVTVTESLKPPQWCFSIRKDSKLEPLFDAEYLSRRRQDLPKSYFVNGAVYAFPRDWFLKTQKFFDSDTMAVPMPAERSIDIDTEFDFQQAELLGKQNKQT